MPSDCRNAACVTGPWLVRGGGARRAAQRREIHVGGQIGFAGLAERIGMAVCAFTA